MKIKPIELLRWVLLLFLTIHSGRRVNAALMLSEDFNGNPLPKMKCSGSARSVVAWIEQGTIDHYMGKASGAIELRTDLTAVGATAALEIGPLTVRNPQETDLTKLTVSFDLWTDIPEPVHVSLTSVDQNGKSGKLTGLVVPQVLNAWHRFSLDLDQTTAEQGRFNPLAPRLTIKFELNAGTNASKRAAGHLLRVDNLSYASPAFYVSGVGNDHDDGRKPSTAYSSIQRAVDAAQPGDVIMVMDGTYAETGVPDISSEPKSAVNGPVWRPWWPATSGSICTIAKAGSPAAWIVLRSQRGQHPRLQNHGGWAAIKIGLGAAYIEIRELTLQGNQDKLSLTEAQADSNITERNGWRYYGRARFNGNGIMVDGRATPDPRIRPHHLRFIGNTVYNFPAGGIVAIGADYVTTSENTVFDNAHFTRWGASGISYLVPFNFDRSNGPKLLVLSNRAYLNRCQVPWVHYQSDANGNPLPSNQGPANTISDGNGIIIDVNRARDNATDGSGTVDYSGRTIVSNNLSYGNGGGGITITTCRGVDVINNTVFDNVQSPNLAARGWADVLVGGPAPGCVNVRFFNNLVFARHAPKSFYIYQSAGITAENNIFHGAPASTADLSDQNNGAGDPLFVNGALKDAEADFHLTIGSPARAAGQDQGLPLLDIEGKPRPAPGNPDLGAYQY